VLPGRTQEIDTDDADSMMEIPESEISILLKEKVLLEKVNAVRHCSRATHLIHGSVALESSVDQ
jgi:hypothetical protein